MPTHINIQIDDRDDNRPQRKLPPANAPISRYHAAPIQAELVEPEPPQQGAVFDLPPRPMDFSIIQNAIAGVLILSGLVLFVSLLQNAFTQPTQQEEPTLTQSEVETLLEQQRLQIEAQYRQAELQRLEAEHQGFKEGVTYGR
jgi:hypothetical protein